MTGGSNRESRRAPAALLAIGLLTAGCIPPGAQSSADRPDPPRRQQSYPAPAPAPRYTPPVSVLPAPPPAWSARPVTPTATIVRSATYVVQPGDTLRSVGNRTGAGSEAIARANNLVAPYTLRPGQRLTIPGGRYHLVREGETGIAIARAYGVDWSRVVTDNGLAEPYILRVGQRVLIPDAGPETLEQRAARFHIDIEDIVTGGEPALAATGKPARPTASSARVLPSTAVVAAPTRLHGSFAWPVRGTVIRRFGPGASGERNDGIKIAVPLDTPILASADGVVAYAGSDVPALGGIVILKHGNGWATVYGHAGQLLVQRGQSVKQGQTIALSGNSGFADRPELHFEIREGRTPVDPLTRLPARQASR